MTWALLSFLAGTFQAGRNALARSLAGEISPWLNSWSRFAFNLPFSLPLVVVLAGLSGVPTLSLEFLGYCLATGISQLLGNVALVSAFRRSNFAQSIVLHKLEVVFTGLIGVALFAEAPTSWGWVGIALCAFGALQMNVGREGNWRHALRFDVGSLLALLAGLLLVFASFFLKEASAALRAANEGMWDGAFESAMYTMFHTTWMEVVILTVWILVRSPRDFASVPRCARRMLAIGFFSFLGSVCWFWAYSIALVAYVKAVGQVEMVWSVAISLFVFRERDVKRQLSGVVVISVGILVVLLS